MRVAVHLDRLGRVRDDPDAGGPQPQEAAPPSRLAGRKQGFCCPGQAVPQAGGGHDEDIQEAVARVDVE